MRFALADSLTEPVGDDFVQHINQQFGSISDSPDNKLLPHIRYTQRVDTSLPDYQLGQMCDVLRIVTGDLAPPTNSNKLALIQHCQRHPGRTQLWAGLLARQYRRAGLANLRPSSMFGTGGQNKKARASNRHWSPPSNRTPLVGAQALLR